MAKILIDTRPLVMALKEPYISEDSAEKNLFVSTSKFLVTVQVAKNFAVYQVQGSRFRVQGY
ncbi:MAG: hypothetical protein AB1567_02710 [bacterium]